MAENTTERIILERVLEAVGRETGITARILQWQPALNWHTPLHPDALVELDIPPRAEQYAVEVKRNIDRYAMLNQLRALWPRHAKPALLVAAPYITRQVAERCREMDLFFADAAGNAYLKAPGLHLYITGRPKPGFTPAAGGKIINPAGLRVVFALLSKPNLLNATYREIAAAARVALGTIGPVIKDLETRRHITPVPDAGRTGHRKFLDPTRLVQEWVAVYPTILRPKLNVRRFRAQKAGWTRDLNLQPYNAFWGGEVAANRLLHQLEPQTATIYARDTPRAIITEQKMRADVNGEVEILDTFWNHLPTVGDVVPPMLAYADLTTTTDGRNLDAARMIYEEYIEPALRNQA